MKIKFSGMLHPVDLYTTSVSEYRNAFIFRGKYSKYNPSKRRLSV
jgi:hypothetical protein